MTEDFNPGCTVLGHEELARRADGLHLSGNPCSWCPRACGADRLGGKKGACGARDGIIVSGCDLHFGEEAHFVGRGGSGTVFFSCCNLGCLFCQNYQISHFGAGRLIDVGELAGMFLELQQSGAENLNLVTPSHYPADIMAALALSVEHGFSLPLVYNTSGYDAIPTLLAFDGVVDIYMPDFKFATGQIGAKLTEVDDYPEAAQAALTEMVRQVGPGLELHRGVARRGISVRHLVLPGYYDDSRACLDFLRSLSPEITVNIMSQYHPSHKAWALPGLDRRVDFHEYRAVVDYAESIGLRHVLAQG